MDMFVSTQSMAEGQYGSDLSYICLYHVCSCLFFTCPYLGAMNIHVNKSSRKTLTDTF